MHGGQIARPLCTQMCLRDVVDHIVVYRGGIRWPLCAVRMTEMEGMRRNVYEKYSVWQMYLQTE